jgi:hypothetical protein
MSITVTATANNHHQLSLNILKRFKAKSKTLSNKTNLSPKWVLALRSVNHMVGLNNKLMTLENKIMNSSTVDLLSNTSQMVNRIYPSVHIKLKAISLLLISFWAPKLPSNFQSLLSPNLTTSVCYLYKLDSKNSEFSIFRPNFTENGSGVTDSAASFSQSRQRQKQIGRISRRHEWSCFLYCNFIQYANYWIGCDRAELLCINNYYYSHVYIGNNFGQWHLFSNIDEDIYNLVEVVSWLVIWLINPGIVSYYSQEWTFIE